jgi:hypothetical protein
VTCSNPLEKEKGSSLALVVEEVRVGRVGF